ncbi:hypothetical protein E4Q08_02575 [Candidatus Accumulibacter phosphatis]|uniref:Uncharacterized protein n=1 Tax=Candidatus Accumulibacter contiguus TaxID=2954381 RepID=A0ABX1T5F2_9PROT|nr:hypothetical protein [Candidatus Accumulibacter contiguus]NMQ04221.1 hypothetical protein [Candidatus Accumulibacter contiguus]
MTKKDAGIVNGFKYAKNAINEIVPANDLSKYKEYIQHSVHLIHYHVPKDIDLNHYFEVMNSRGEQLEKHEIIKARLIEKPKQRRQSKVQSPLGKLQRNEGLHTAKVS